MKRVAALAFALAILSVPRAGVAAGGILSGEQTWSGEVRLTEDLYVPPGSSLTVLPGTRVVVTPSESTKVEPGFWSTETEIAVGGTLSVRGTPDRPVTFEGEGTWAGVVAAPGSRVTLTGTTLRGAEAGLSCVGADCRLERVRIEAGEYGLILGPGARVEASGAEISGCRVGVLDSRANGASLEGISVRDPRDADRLKGATSGRSTRQEPARTPAVGPRVEYVGDYTVQSDEIWQGQVLLSGRVTVVPGAVLTLKPGTQVSFRKVDTNGDGLGEAELLILGGIRSRGTPDKPVIFQSAEGSPAPGDWDKVSVISSEDPDNLFERTVFRHGTQALHAHFSRVAARSCLFEENLRAVQFQESDGATLEKCEFRGNKQALRFRDSKVRAVGNVFSGNLFGVHAYRADLEFSDNVLEGSSLGGFLAKESRVVFERNRVGSSRDGVRIKDPGSWVRIRGNRFEGFAEDALSLSRVEGTVEGNRFDGAGLDLVGLEDAPVVLRGNHFGAAGRDALHLKGRTDVDAKGNFWGGGDPADRIHDGKDDPALGRATTSPALPETPRLDLKER